jgi:hypothetical protein
MLVQTRAGPWLTELNIISVPPTSSNSLAGNLGNGNGNGLDLYFPTNKATHASIVACGRAILGCSPSPLYVSWPAAYQLSLPWLK